jgi:predicted permease
MYYLSKSDDGSGRASAAEQVLTLPVTYAVVAAGVVLAFDLVPPTSGPAMKSIKLLGDASIPLFLLILGLQVAEMRPGQTVRRTLPTVSVKLLVAPVVAAVLTLVFGFADSVVLAAGPAAVTPLVLTIEFTDDNMAGVSAAEYVGTVVLLAIFGAFPVVTGLIFLFEVGI